MVGGARTTWLRIEGLHFHTTPAVPQLAVFQIPNYFAWHPANCFSSCPSIHGLSICASAESMVPDPGERARTPERALV